MRKSTSGYTWQLAGASVSWSSKLQSTIALSSTEAEVIALNHAGKEGKWMKKLLRSLRPLIREETNMCKNLLINVDTSSGHHCLDRTRQPTASQALRCPILLNTRENRTQRVLS